MGSRNPKKVSPLLMVALGLPLAILAVPLTLGLISLVSSFAEAFLYSHGHHAVKHVDFPLIMVAPFAALLLSIALMPFAPPKVHHWWEENKNRLIVALGLALPVVIYMYATEDSADASANLWHSVQEYISFVALLFALYTISGGIHLQGNLVGTPVVNSIFLAVGTILASVVGTTGASMLLIRPMLSTNRERKHVTHIYVFFIFLVSNIGGSLTPLGDPPLFLGFLRGVPFFWTLALTPMWAFTSVLLLALFFAVDTVFYRRETKADLIRDEMEYVPLRILGKRHAYYLIGVIALIILTPEVEKSFSHGEHTLNLWWIRDGLMTTMALMSLRTGDPEVRYTKNRFNFHAIGEVAALFIGIFICMIPALSILEDNGKRGKLPVETPAQFLWATGVSSGFLDNAPTYLVFVKIGNGVMDNKAGGEVEPGDEVTVRDTKYIIKKETLDLPQEYLLAISVGAVFFGALSYIGNAPNFMVSAICVGEGVRMPSFLGYLKWSFGILLPVYVIVTLVFF